MFSNFYFYTGLLLLLILGACTRVNSDAAPPTNSDVENPPVGVVDDSAGFYVQHVASDNYTYVTHKGNTTFSTPCTAAVGELATCYVEGEELDAYAQGVQLQYNLPSTMCDYFVLKPYWYFTNTAGMGPASITVDTDMNGTQGVDPGNTGTVTGPVPTCAYDHSHDTVPGPNCCVGTYSEVTRSWDTTTGAYDITSSTTGNSWGGLIGNCAGGPAMDTQTINALTGLPEGTITEIQGTGLNAIYTVAAPISKNFGTDIFVADFFDAANFVGGSNLPPALSPVTVGTSTFSPTYVYDFACVDHAFEYIAEVQVYFRKWDTEANFNAMASNPAGYNVTGNEPAPWAAQPLDDFAGWDEFGTNYPKMGQ